MKALSCPPSPPLILLWRHNLDTVKYTNLKTKLDEFLCVYTYLTTMWIKVENISIPPESSSEPHSLSIPTPLKKPEGAPVLTSIPM